MGVNLSEEIGLTPLPDAVFESAVRAVAPRKFDIWKKLLIGAYARTDLAERQRNELAAELAELKQQRKT